MKQKKVDYTVHLNASIAATIRVPASSEYDARAQVEKMFEDNDIEMMDNIRYDYGLDNGEILRVDEEPSAQADGLGIELP